MHIAQLEEGARQELQRILDTDVNALTDDDKAFLRARRDYLTGEQKKVYETLLNTGHEDAQSAQNADQDVVPPVAEKAPRKRRKDHELEV